MEILREQAESTRELRYIEGTDSGGWKEYVDEENQADAHIK
ncbi:MAG: hypothetical protein WKF84_30440 [Pyrinomonadaceae bacterium]